MTVTPFSGTTFWLITFAFVVFYGFMRKVNAAMWARNCFMIAASAAVVSLTISNRLILLPILLLLSILVYSTGKTMSVSMQNGYGKNSMTGVITIIVICLCYFKYSIVQSYVNTMGIFFAQSQQTHNIAGRGDHLFFIGISYFSFKFIHFLLECHNKKVENLSFLTFINYILFFPSFFSGPINRYNFFAESIAAENEVAGNFLCGAKRIINGLFKKIVLGDFLFPYSIAALDLNSASRLDIVIGCYAYMFYIYFNFSGYTDMAIGCGRMVGIELPENFNYPFLKRNLQQFWANWHMSLTTWLTDYIYWPLARKFRDMQALRKKPVTLSNICIIITFLACGLWHGDGFNFFIWGAYHGFGLAALNGYTYLVKKYGSMRIRKFITKSPLAYGVSNFITFQYVAFGFMLFACDMERLKGISEMFF